MLTATKIRLYPNLAERDSLARQFGCVRFVRNKALAMKKTAWVERKESLSCYTIKSMIPVWKAGEFPWLKEADSQALQSAILNLDVAYKNFFERRAGFPRFLKKHDVRQSIQYPQRVKIDGDRIYLCKRADGGEIETAWEAYCEALKQMGFAHLKEMPRGCLLGTAVLAGFLGSSTSSVFGSASQGGDDSM